MSLKKIFGVGIVLAVPLGLYGLDVKKINESTNDYILYGDYITQMNAKRNQDIIKVGAEEKSKIGKYKTVEWLDLIPEDELELLAQPLEIDHGDPSLLDEIIDNTEVITPFGNEESAKQIKFGTVIPDWDGKSVRIAGFVVPLEFKDKNITRFLLVPYFGACIHVPPPPPNQIIMVNFPKGLEERNIYDPIWVSGILETTLIQSELATSGYSLQAHSYDEYF